MVKDFAFEKLRVSISIGLPRKALLLLLRWRSWHYCLTLCVA
jgi:hypothetical protein